MNEDQFRIREATSGDVPALLALIKHLAAFERLSHEVTASEEHFKKFGFGESPYYYALLVEELEHKQAIGFALYFFTFSTFSGSPTLYLEDVFVLPEYRGKGIGKALLKKLADIAINNDCQRMDWAVLDWNISAIKFYRSIGAFPLSEWTTFRMNRQALEKFIQE